MPCLFAMSKLISVFCLPVHKRIPWSDYNEVINVNAVMLSILTSKLNHAVDISYITMQEHRELAGHLQ